MNKDFLKSRGIKEPECGFDHPEGWNKLVEKLVDDLIALGWNKELHQTKEKFGALRFYTGEMTDEMYELVKQAEFQSKKLCEECGAVGILRGGGWLRTLCDSCSKGRPVYE